MNQDYSLPQPADPSEQKIALLTGQLLNVQRAVFNIQRMEADLRRQLASITGVTLPEPAMLAIEDPAATTAETAIESKNETVDKYSPRVVRSFTAHDCLLLLTLFYASATCHAT